MKKKSKPVRLKYSDAQVKEMLKNSVYWHEQLREAANERGQTFYSITPIAEIMSWLWKNIS